MKNLLLLLLLVAWPAPAVELSALAVKTISRGLQEARTFKGSGLLFRRDGKTYVVTSDHVILHGNEGYAQRITSPTLGEHRVKLLVAEWATGLALLEVPDLAPRPEFPDLAQLTTALPAKGDPVVLVGYPLDSDQPIEDPRGKVVDPRFESPLFYSVTHLIQVLDAHGEFGMSGGPLFSESGAFLGLLSHQIVRNGPRPENKLLILPAPAVHAWLSSYFKDPAGYRSPFAVPPRIQFDSGDSVIVRDIQFTEYRGGTVETFWTGVPQTPIALPDPTGVLERIRDFSQRYQGEATGVSFRCFRRRGEIGGRCLRIAYRSIAELFRLIAREDIEPVTVTGINFRDDLLRKMRPICDKLRAWPEMDVVRDRCHDDYALVKPIDLWAVIQKHPPYESILRELLAIWRKLTV